jgi:hypothetical protein
MTSPRNQQPSTWASLTSHFRGWLLVPAIYISLGIIILVAQAVDGHAAAGFGWFLVMLAIGAVYTLGGRFEVIRQARGDFADERDASINRRAMATTGTVLVIVLTACMVFNLARGESPSPYSELTTVSGLAYLASLIALRYRS